MGGMKPSANFFCYIWAACEFCCQGLTPSESAVFGWSLAAARILLLDKGLHLANNHLYDETVRKTPP